MILDLVTEEERISHLTGMAFEQLLSWVDELHPAQLTETYERVVDRYLVLSGKGRRNSQEQIELDRLDSSLRFLLGEGGVLATTGRLLGLLEILDNSMRLLLNAGNRSALTQAALALHRARSRFQKNLQGTHLAASAPYLFVSLERAGRLTLACAAQTKPRLWWLPYRRLRPADPLLTLVEQLAAAQAEPSAWQAAETLASNLRPARARRLAGGVLSLSAWLACLQAWQGTTRALGDCAGLIRESLQA